MQIKIEKYFSILNIITKHIAINKKIWWMEKWWCVMKNEFY